MGGFVGGALVSYVASALDKPRMPSLMDINDRDTLRPDAITNIFASAGLTAANIPGASVLVLNNSKVLFQRGYGVTDLRSLRKIDNSTNFRLASCTKQFTAMAIMLLVNDAKLHYDDR